MFIIKMSGLYGMKDQTAFYRELGDCFDFVNRKEYATRYETEAACEKVLKHKEWYCKQYGASEMEIVSFDSEVSK